MRCWILLVSLCAAAPFLRADSLPANARSLLREYFQSRAPDDLADLTGTDLVSFYIADRLREESLPAGVSVAGFRGDLQLGSIAPTGASTSIVARPGLTDLMSAAIESGAVARTNDDKTSTFSFNALPIFQVLSGRAPIGCGSEDQDCETGSGRWIRGLSGSISLNLSHASMAVPRNSGSTGLPDGVQGFLLGGRRVNTVAVRYELLVRERRDAEAQQALDAIAGRLSGVAWAFLAQQATFEERLGDLLSAANWFSLTQALIEETANRPGATLANLEAVLLNRYRVAYTMAASTPELSTATNSVEQVRLDYVRAQNRELADKLYRKAVTVDYSNQRPSDQPGLHQLRIVVSTPLGRKPSGGRLTRATVQPEVNLTFNGGFSIYGTDGAATANGRVRDASASVALDWSPAAWGRVRPTYTAAYYFQYMLEDAVIQFNQQAVTPGGAAIPLSGAASEVLNTRGAIHVAQLRVNIPLGASGVNFPLGVSYSNRTELITGRPFWQGHIGMNYDLSSLKRLIALPGR